MKKAIIGSLLLSLFAVLVTVLDYLMPSGRETARHSLTALENKVSFLHDSQNKSNNKLNTLVGAVASCRSSLALIQQSLNSIAGQTASPVSAVPPAEHAAEAPESNAPEMTPIADAEAVQMSFLEFSNKTLKDVLNDDQINPEKIVPDRITKARIQLELTRAQSQIAVLRSEIALETIQAMTELGEEGQFIEYQAGDAPPSLNDSSVLPVAEGLSSGLCRMYFLERERFPSVHELRDERALVTSQAVSKIAQLIANPEKQ